MHWTERCDCPRGATTMKRSRETSIGPRPWIEPRRDRAAVRADELRGRSRIAGRAERRRPRQDEHRRHPGQGVLDVALFGSRPRPRKTSGTAAESASVKKQRGFVSRQ
ncbi:hypothetical protein [Methylobacterium radiotolerans]|uniref:hypothetical protein n=1 Tax=Methylobacterium radiotolerans TaxID=31998 RepID=UPI001115561C|nr:hypothetical protein [Methylobacterium radiotolerans]